MKIIHTADIHLGSSMDSVLPYAKAKERKTELRATFGRMIEYARAEGVRVIMLTGDVFYSELPKMKDKEFFYDAVRHNPDIDFLYLRGNHDRREENVQDLPNLKLFDDSWTCYSYEDVDIYGIESTKENAFTVYSSFKAYPERKNIVMLHGQIGTVSDEHCVNLNELRAKNIDYLALGHIHSYMEEKLDDRGVYAYSGCLEGRGFDELGEKGFVLLDIGEEIKRRFVPFASRTIHEVSVNLTACPNLYAAEQEVKKHLSLNKEDLLRLTLTGELDFDQTSLSDDVKNFLSDSFYFVSVKDRTVRRYDPHEYENNLSLRGEFIRTVLSDEELSEEEKSAIIALGIRALDGREVEV